MLAFLVDGTTLHGKKNEMVTKFVNQVNFHIPATPHKTQLENFLELDNNAYQIPDLIPAQEIASIRESLQEANWQPVSVTGMSGNWTPGDPIGSYRASNYTPEYADVLWDRIKDQLPSQRKFTSIDNTDYDAHVTWEPIGVSPLLRFIKYENGGWLVVHYDAPYIEDENVRTLQSFVIYLNQDEGITGGATRYLHDPQQHLPIVKRDLSDQLRAAKEHEVRLRFSPANGTGVIFDHRLLHDAEKVEGVGEKLIIRTDIMYRKVFHA